MARELAGKEPPEGMTQEQAARRVGCSQSTVSRAIARGDIEPLSNGRLPESSLEVLRNLRKEDFQATKETADLERRLLTAQAAEREAKAESAKLRLQMESGKYVELAGVQKAGADAARRILAVLRAIPQRVALEVDGALSASPDRRAAAIEKLISAEVERAIGELNRSMYLQVEEEPKP